jgi:hypothetical protein
VGVVADYIRSISRSIPTSTARRVRSSSQSISGRRTPGSAGSPELADLFGSLKVGQHEDVEQLGAGSRPEGVQALTDRRSSSSGRVGTYPSPFGQRRHDKESHRHQEPGEL